MVETFEGFSDGQPLTTEIAGLVISAPSAPSGTPTVVLASEPEVPGEPMGLAHLPYFDPPDYLVIDFSPSTSTAGAVIDLGFIGNGVKITAYDDWGATGAVLGSATTTIDGGYISVTQPGIKSVRFETIGLVTYLIDNLTYDLGIAVGVEDGIRSESWGRTKTLYR